MRNSNPHLRIRDDLSLGPRKVVEVTSAKRSTLKAPKSFFVELDVYRRDYPEKVLLEKDILWEETSPGVWKQGVIWPNLRNPSALQTELRSTSALGRKATTGGRRLLIRLSTRRWRFTQGMWSLAMGQSSNSRWQ